MCSDDVLFVTGGFHLIHTLPTQIKAIISDFKELGVLYVGPCHCSGSTARTLFEEVYGSRFIPVGVGMVITLDDLKMKELSTQRSSSVKCTIW